MLSVKWRITLSGWRDVASAFANQLFPERQFIYRRRGEVRYLALSQPLQVFLVLVSLTLLGWVFYASSMVYLGDRTARSRETKIALLERDYRELVTEWRATQERFAGVTGELEQNNRHLMSVLKQRAQLEEHLGRTTSELSRITAQRDDAMSHSGQLQRKVADLEVALRGAVTDRRGIDDALSSTRTKLAMLAQRHKEATRAQQAQISARTGGRETRLDRIGIAQEDLASRIQEQASSAIKNVAAMIDATGVPFRELLARASQEGLGGPFIPIEVASAAGNAPVDLRRGDTNAKMAQWDVVKLLVKRLPLAAPVHKHELKSGFGRRVDPFTGQWAVHDGVDLAGTQRSAILATGQGVVSFVGTRGPYGRTVEITHGLGLVTRYAHLRRTAVKQGEEVEVGQAIGEMGSSGRSTGPHLHYEVHFDGKPIDPELFLRAGQVVAKK